jgi:hypothetical protein
VNLKTIHVLAGQHAGDSIGAGMREYTPRNTRPQGILDRGGARRGPDLSRFQTRINIAKNQAAFPRNLSSDTLKETHV